MKSIRPPSRSRRPLPLPARPPSTVFAEPIRWPNVMTARARIAVQFYDRPDVRASVLAAVLDELMRE
jgi:hypothetical protein